jgi:hypothetical protein
MRQAFPPILLPPFVPYTAASQGRLRLDDTKVEMPATFWSLFLRVFVVKLSLVLQIKPSGESRQIKPNQGESNPPKSLRVQMEGGPGPRRLLPPSAAQSEPRITHPKFSSRYYNARV